MDILTFFTPAEMTGLDLDSETVIVIDVLRGTTTLAAALKAGASKIIPVSEVDTAFKLADKIGRQRIILGGNDNFQEINGFDLGNSPLEYTLDAIQRKTLIYYSPNTGRAIESCRDAGRVLCGCFNNMQAVINAIDKSSSIVFLCAGKMGRFSLEDTVCAGMFIQYILNSLESDFSLNDASSTARYLYYRHHRNVLGMLAQTAHGHYLNKLGFYKDLEHAAMMNVINMVPELSPDKTHLIPTVAVEIML